MCVLTNRYRDMPRGVKKGVSKQKFERTVKKIKRKGSAKNPYAVANAKLKRTSKRRTSSSNSSSGRRRRNSKSRR
jgi:hypothetical protein